MEDTIGIVNKDPDFQEALVEVRKKKMKKKIIYISIVAAAVLLLLFSMWLIGYSHSQNLAQRQIDELVERIHELETTPVVVDPVTPEIVMGVISAKTTEISELASAEYLFTNAAKFTSGGSGGIFDWVTQKSFIQKWSGNIKAGVDLSKVSVTVQDNVITVTLPAARILSYEIDYDSVEVLNEENNVFNPITVEDKNNFDAATAEAMKTRAVDHGLLTQAQKNAENIIGNLLNASLEGLEDYRIEFKTATE